MQSARSASSSATGATSATGAGAPSGAAASKPAEVAEAHSDGGEGEELIAPARELFRVAACGATGEVPERLDRKLVDRHCKELLQIYAAYRKRWLSVAMPFIAGIRPADLPRRVTYPFGGGDLVTALAVYPDAEEFTALSLEPPGDVRRIDTVHPLRMNGALTLTGRNLRKILGISYSNTVNLGKGARAALPGEIVMLMGALVVHGYEPTSLRYFELLPDGKLHYLTAAELDAEANRPSAPKEGADAPFSNVEMRFKKVGAEGPTKVMRHIAHDLANREVGKDPGLRAYLESRGPISAITKAASHLLWADEFSWIRDYLLEHAEWMISDSTGVPPRFAQAAGFVQDTYGTFDNPTHYGPIEPLDGRAFRHLFRENPPRALPFQFGYTDVHRHSHMVVMHKRAGGAVPPSATPVPAEGRGPSDAK